MIFWHFPLKVSIFRNGIIEKTVMEMSLYGLSVSFVNPKGTSSSKANMMPQKNIEWINI